MEETTRIHRNRRDAERAPGARSASFQALLMRLPRLFGQFVIVGGGLLSGPGAFAHDPGLSSVAILVESSSVEARMTLSSADFASLKLEGQLPAGRIIDLSVDGTPLAIGTPFLQRTGDAVHILLRFPRSGGSNFRVRSALLERLPRGHRQFLTVRTTDGAVLAERVLDARNDSVDVGLVVRPPAARSPEFGRFLLLGIEHILSGWDHLAFLFALLLVGPSLREAAKVITSFTVAHSITLALAALDIVRVSPSLVEPLIAASVLYVGVENLVRRRPGRRWPLTFGFGLVHGFGFAAVLREMNIAGNGTGAILPLAGFNLGVEVGQIAVASLILPLVWALGRRADHPSEESFPTGEPAPWWVPAGSSLVSLAGGVWLVLRVCSF